MKAFEIIELAKQRQQAMRDIRRERRRRRLSYRKITDAELRQEITEAIEAVCRSGARCPTNEELEKQIHTRAPRYFRNMAREGYFRIEVSCHNWRTVEIRRGPYLGLKSKAPDKQTRAYVVIEKR